eukprot:TRINITY_DN9830_c0_g1_i1.p2 TRINITY_DN9830_c0_g1~~TRINITY_DN9830_c0_g1_i1.p2  ORF type:complete len:344 (+),score=104.63 TRINITY_DN9830_c0_g1_i1:23-1054(+)
MSVDFDDFKTPTIVFAYKNERDLDLLLRNLPLRSSANANETIEKDVIHKMHLETKYYNADVPVHLLTFEHSLPNECQALVIVFREESEWPHVRDWFDKASENSPEILTIVRVGSNISFDDDQEIESESFDSPSMDKFREEALDAGFEWIDYDTERDYSKAKDKDGYARLIEALEGYVWSSWKDHDAEQGSDDEHDETGDEIPKVQDQDEYAIDAEAIQGPSFTDGLMSLSRKSQVGTTSKEDASAPAEKQKPDDRETFLKTLIGPDPTQSETQEAKKKKKRRNKKKAAPKADEEEVESFENLLASMMRMREVARQSSDKDRKRIAEQFTMQLLQAMGDDSEED